VGCKASNQLTTMLDAATSGKRRSQTGVGETPSFKLQPCRNRRQKPPSSSPCCFSELSDCGYSVHQRNEADLNEVAYGHGPRGRGILWSSGSPVQRGIPLAESHQPSCKPLIAKGIDSSSIAPRIGHLLQVAPIESAAAGDFFRCARISARGTPDRALTTYGSSSEACASQCTCLASNCAGLMEAEARMPRAFLRPRFAQFP
jgi:hypothetical protein